MEEKQYDNALQMAEKKETVNQFLTIFKKLTLLKKGGVGERPGMPQCENASAQRGARTHDPGIKSPMLYRLS